MVEFLNLSRDSVLVLLGHSADEENESMQQLQSLLKLVPSRTEVVVANPKSSSSAEAYLARHLSNRNQTAYLRLFFVGQVEEGQLLFSKNDGLDATRIAELYSNRTHRIPFTFCYLSDNRLADEAKEALEGAGIQLAESVGDGVTWKQACAVLRQEDGLFYFEQFVQGVWPGVSLAKWRWDQAVEEGQRALLAHGGASASSSDDSAFLGLSSNVLVWSTVFFALGLLLSWAKAK
ncbi:hypothetical protein QOT17_023272 [Balamuthia mandrillaris]